MTKDEAVADLHDAGPGSICADCGHFAARHEGLTCQFPRPADNPCKCGGMLWHSHRLPMNRNVAELGDFKMPAEWAGELGLPDVGPVWKDYPITKAEFLARQGKWDERGRSLT